MLGIGCADRGHDCATLVLTGARAARLAIGFLFLQVLVSIETFNTAFSGLSDADVVRQTADLRPQIASLALWSLTIVLSLLPGTARFGRHPRTMLLPAAVLAWSAASFAWSADPAVAMPKAAALVISNYGAWRLAALISVRDMFGTLYAALAVLLLASVCLALAVPSIGVVQTEWQHVGDWQGVFASKQGLGMVSAIFLGIVLLRVAERWRALDVAMALVGFSCLIGSASRGAGAIAVVAVACLIAARLQPRATFIVPAVLVTALALATANICYFAATGNWTIHFFGSSLDVTQRTFIWQFAIERWETRPLLGYGLNGFWTDPANYDGFLRLHGWVLDNYHDGYVAVLVETGLVGFGLFLAMCLSLILRLHRLLLETPRAQRLSLEMAAGFLVMFLTINLTETYLSRSTNFMALLFAFLVAKIIPAAARQAAPARSAVPA